MKNFFSNYFDELTSTLKELDCKDLDKVKKEIIKARKNEKTIFIIGNGGSASTASHITCDLSKGILGHTGEKKIDRLRVISLDNLATLTAWSNDVGYDEAMAEQLRNLIRKGDLLIAISASGNSPNVIKAVDVAKEAGAKVVGLSGFSGGELKEKSDINLLAKIDKYDVAEDIHLIIGHILTRWLYENL